MNLSLRNQLQHNLPWHVKITEIISYCTMLKAALNKTTQTLQMFHAKCQNPKIENVALITLGLIASGHCHCSAILMWQSHPQLERANLRATHCSITHIGCCLSAESTDYIWCCNQLCDIVHQSEIKFLLKIIKPKSYLYVISYINVRNESLCSWKVEFIDSIHNPLFRIYQNTRKICKKVYITYSRRSKL